MILITAKNTFSFTQTKFKREIKNAFGIQDEHPFLFYCPVAFILFIYLFILPIHSFIQLACCSLFPNKYSQFCHIFS